MDEDDLRLFRVCDLCRILTVSRSGLYLLKKNDKTFPPFLPLTSGRRGVRRSDLVAWLRGRG